MILLFGKCCSCAIRLVKQPKKAGTSQVVFLIELLGFPGGKEGEEKEKERERAQSILNQTTEITHSFNTLEVEWCLQYTLLALMPQEESQ